MTQTETMTRAHHDTHLYTIRRKEDPMFGKERAWHAVRPNGVALCGTVPGSSSGWSTYTGPAATCARCAGRVERLARK